MVRSVQMLSVTLANVLGYSWAIFPSLAGAHTNPIGRLQMASAKHSYNPQMVRFYTYECAKRLQEIKGDSPEHAKRICQCSITQMQQQYSQSQAIQLVTKAQTSINNEPKVIPSELFPFFTPCTSKKG